MKKVVPFNSERSEQNKAARGVPASAPSVVAQPELPVGAEEQLVLLQRLIGCTDQQSLIGRFFRWANDLQLADGIRFEAKEKGTALLVGHRRHHSAQYDLNINKQAVGDISIFRRSRYSESELATLEQALGALARALHSASEVHALRNLVSQDPLTGLGNRTHLDESVSRELARARRHGDPLAVMMIDVDYFKEINDILGHIGGDRVLRTIADVLRASTRCSDMVFRYGGDEFTVLLPHTGESGAEEAARQIRANLGKLDAAVFGGEESLGFIRPDLSIGVACYRDGDDEESLMQRADKHLYSAKAQGRARVCTAV